jgi:hypothetical protein
MGQHTFYPVAAFSLLVLISLCCYGAQLAEPAGTPPAAVGSAPTAESEQPAEESEATEPIPTAEPEEPTEPPSGPTPPSEPEVEERIAEVEWPASMRVGDSDVIRFSLIPSPDGGYVAEPEIPGHEIEPTPLPLTVARPGYTGYAIASLSAAGLEAEAASPDKQLLTPGQPNTWRWTVLPDEAGDYRVVVNLSLRWEPNAGTELPGPFEEAVWSRIMTIEARATLGLSGLQIDWVGLGGSVLGTIAGLPFTKKVLETLRDRASRWRGKDVGG